MKKSISILLALIIFFSMIGIVSADKEIEAIVEIEDIFQGSASNCIGMTTIPDSQDISFNISDTGLCYALIEENVDSVTIMGFIFGSFEFQIDGTTYNTFIPAIQALYAGGDRNSLIEDSITEIGGYFPSKDIDDDSYFIGNIRIILSNSNEFFEVGEVIINGAVVENEEDHEQRISDLESWQEETQSIIDSILDSISNIMIGTNYFKYLASTDRKNAVCGYSLENHLTNVTDLGWNCITAYKISSSGKETSSCKCKKT